MCVARGLVSCGSAIGSLLLSTALPLPCRSGNVLLSQDWRASLADLGLAQVMENTARTAAGGSNLYAGGLLGVRPSFL